MPDDMSRELGPTYNPLYRDSPRELPRDPDEAQAWRAIEKAAAIGAGGLGREGATGRELTLQERLEQERLAREATRGSWFIEGLRRTENPQALRFLAHGILASWEAYPRHFSEYTALQYIGILNDRVEGYKALVEVPPATLKQLGLVTEEISDEQFVARLASGDRSVLTTERGLFRTKLQGEELKDFANGVAEVRDEFIARSTILEVYKQQGQMAGDTKQYGFQFFIAPWRVKTEAKHYAAIGTAKESLPNKEDYGVLVDEAMRGWIDIEEGRVIDPYKRMKDDTGDLLDKKPPTDEQGRIEPVFNNDLYESKLERARKWIAKYRTGGDEQAVQTAWLLLRHLDIHVSYAMKGGRLVDPKEPNKPGQGRRMLEILSAIGKFDLRDYLAPPYKQLCADRGDLGETITTPEEVSDVSLVAVGDVGVEASESTNDTAKANFIAVRQLAEFTKDNPRAVAAPATIGCFPNLTTDMLRMITFGDKSMWELWRKNGVRFGEFPWDEKDKADNEKKIGWKSPADGKYYQGIAKTMHHVPYGLQGMYALGKVYESIMNDEFAKMGEQILDPSYLAGLNKAYELAFAIMWGRAINIKEPKLDDSGQVVKEKVTKEDGAEEEVVVMVDQSEKDPSKNTLKKLRQLTKLNMLAGWAIANTYGNVNNPQNLVDRLGLPMVPDTLLMQKPRQDRKAYLNLLIDAATKSGFLSTRDHDDGKKAIKVNGINAKSLYDAEVELLTEMVETRRLGYKPSALIERGWFGPEEIMKLNDLGVYAPFKA